jgi:TonB family protein
VVPLIGGAGWIVSCLLKRLGPRTLHVLWVATLTLAILAPAFPFCRWLLTFIYLPDAAAGHSSIVVSAAQVGGPGAKGVAILPAALILALFCSYVCALVYFAIRLVWSLYRTTALLRDSSAASLKPEDDELWNRCKQAFALDDATILSTRRAYGPVTIGLRTPVLLIPTGFIEQCSSRDLLTALGHECAHMVRRDFQKNLFYEVASLAIAFHPVTWMLKSQIAQTREMICDALAIEKLIDSHSYTRSLLQLASTIAAVPRIATSHAIGIFDANILEKRIMYIKTKKQSVSLTMRYGLIIPGTLLLFSVAAGGAAMAIGVDEAKQPVQIYKPGGDVSAPKLVSATDPVYPKSDRKGPFEGKCVLKLVVDASGKPNDIHVVRSLGKDFDESAIEAVQQYRFTPAMRQGKPVAVAVNIEVNFKKY